MTPVIIVVDVKDRMKGNRMTFRKRKGSFIVSLFYLIAQYWKSKEKKSAYLYLVGILLLTIAAVYMTLLLNDWFNEFYSALQNYDQDAVYHGLLKFTGLAFAYIAFSVYSYYLQQTLALRWRQWMTREYLARWTSHDMYYRMEMFSKGNADNPDQRISEDIQLFTTQTLSFMAGLLKAITTIFCFIFILWNLSEPLTFTWQGNEYHVYGYLVWTALAYSIIGTWITHQVGYKLVALNFVQQKLEANFRYAMVRLRETAESVAFYEGAQRENGILENRFQKLVGNTIYIIKKQKQLSWLTNSYGQIAIIFPFVVAAPRYLSKSISLGGLMQVANCFGKVQESMSYFVDVYSSLAAWQSCVQRLLTFDEHMEKLLQETEEEERQLKREEKENALILSDVEIGLPTGKVLLSHMNIDIHPGDTVIIKGSSGKGKSTLLRTLAGFWPYAKGHMVLPKREETMFIPQRPYMPMGTLLEAAAYPESHVSRETLEPLLDSCHLSHLKDMLEKEGDWSHILSLGEQQKLAFVRIFLKKPKWVFLDEATSAMDEETENNLYGKLVATPGITVISVGHRSTLDKWHSRSIML